MGRLVINGEEVYELDEDCLKEKNQRPFSMHEACASRQKRLSKEIKSSSLSASAFKTRAGSNET